MDELIEVAIYVQVRGTYPKSKVQGMFKSLSEVAYADVREGSDFVLMNTETEVKF